MISEYAILECFTFIQKDSIGVETLCASSGYKSYDCIKDRFPDTSEEDFLEQINVLIGKGFLEHSGIAKQGSRYMGGIKITKPGFLHYYDFKTKPHIGFR